MIDALLNVPNAYQEFNVPPPPPHAAQSTVWLHANCVCIVIVMRFRIEFLVNELVCRCAAFRYCFRTHFNWKRTNIFTHRITSDAIAYDRRQQRK